jgi:hypothetical protein
LSDIVFGEAKRRSEYGVDTGRISDLLGVDTLQLAGHDADRVHAVPPDVHRRSSFELRVEASVTRPHGQRRAGG